MSEPVSFTLEEYRLQREYREQKRKQYLSRFEALKAKMSLSAGGHQPQIDHPVMQPLKHQNVPPVAPGASQKDKDAQLQNEKLRAEVIVVATQLAELEQEQRKKLGAFKSQIESVKVKYIERIKAISETSSAQKKESEERIKKLESQLKNAANKNSEIQGVNKQLEEQLGQGDSLMERYSQEINKEYSSKLEEFEKIFESSSEKIEAMEKEYNEDQFIDNTLKNQELIETLKLNSERGDDDIDQIIADYKELLKGKTQILSELTQNNEMKTRQISKMTELEGKLKVIFEKLNEEKRLYLEENSKMAEELMQVKNLLMSSMGAAREE